MRSFKLCIWPCAFLFLFLVACVPSPDLKLAQDAMMSGDLETAHRHYVNILRENPSNKTAMDALNQIRPQLAEKARQEAAANMQSSNVVTAPLLRASLARLQRASEFDPDGSLLGSDIRKYQSSLAQLDDANRSRAQQVRDLLAARQFVDAKKSLDAISQTDPDFADLPLLKNEFTQSYGSFLEDVIISAYQAGKVKDAQAAMQQWLDLGFPPAEQSRFQAEVKKQEIAILKKKNRELTGKQQYYKAFLELNQSQYKDDMSDMLDTIRRNGARFYLNQARKRLDRNDLNRAYLEAVKGFELNPDLPGIFEIHRDTRDEVLEKVQRYIAIPAFDSPKDSPDVGTQFSDALISYLFRILPYGINIVERGKIDILIEEHKREYTEVANILNVDLIVTGNVSLLNIDQQNNERQSTVRVPVGEKMGINPEYELFLQTSNGQNMSQAPPKTIKIPEYGNFTINKGRSVIKGFANVAVRIFDTSKGRITYAQEFNANYQAEDDYQDALELAGIEGDPLTLPTDTEVREKLRTQIVKQLADVVQKQFEKREKDFLESARYHLSRREKEIAIDELARGFLYCVKAKVAFNDPDFTEIRDKIIELTETNYL
ncbi:MAG: hypothetical protein KQH63_05870 [Desulfobulbaceae bacterium]|nr:hypothetical protein [Desulfobulbaceae bacterium]